ncbi:MAG: SDR family NAD(P)-dependent oxidoreductase [Ginsengibacter sp.]
MTDFNLKNKTFLVTGSSSGIGKQTAISLSQYGGRICITGRNEQRLAETLSLLKGENHLMIKADLTNEDDALNLINELPKLDGVVFSSGIVEYWPVKFIDLNKIRKIFDVNFDSQVILTQRLLKNKRINRNSSLVYISSISSKIGVPGTALYAASKAAVNAFVKVLASELAGQGIRVNAICPGIVKTPMIDKAQIVVTQETIEKGEAAYLLGYGTQADVANAAIYLLSDASRWMTGNELILDGGLTNL